MQGNKLLAPPDKCQTATACSACHPDIHTYSTRRFSGHIILASSLLQMKAFQLVGLGAFFLGGGATSCCPSCIWMTMGVVCGSRMRPERTWTQRTQYTHMTYTWSLLSSSRARFWSVQLLVSSKCHLGFSHPLLNGHWPPMALYADPK